MDCGRSQRLGLAITWVAMALPVVLFPGTVLRLSLGKRLLQRPARRDHAQKAHALSLSEVFLTRCFGLQALLVGVLLSVCRLSAPGFTVFEMALGPFLVADVLWFADGRINASAALLDAAGTVVCLALCVLGRRACTS